jgi:SAM-dependent methyltransferase
MEHLDDDDKALKELRRVLKVGGTLAITVPNKHFPFLWDPLNWLLMHYFNTHINKDRWWLAGIWADHVRLYSVEEIRQKVNKRLKVVKVETFIHWCWPFTHFLLYGIGKNIVEKLPGTAFNRFDFSKEKPLSRFIAQFVALPSRVLDKRWKTSRTMDIGLLATKESGA